MNRTTLTTLLSGTDQADVTSGNACWQTPPEVFFDLHERYGFDIDLFADADRALCSTFLGPGSRHTENALAAHWDVYGEFGFSNPPYGRFVAQVLAKAAEEALHGFSSAHLLPLRMTKAMRQAIFRSGHVSDLLIADKRITFFENDRPRLDAKGSPSPAPFDSCVVVFRPGYQHMPRLIEWKVPAHVPAEYRRAA